MSLRRALLLIPAGLALGLAFAPFPLRFIAFFALVPLFWAIDDRRSKVTSRRAFLWGWLFGGVAAASHLWWLWFLIVPVEPVTRFLLNIGVVVLFAYLGLYVGVFALLVRRLGLWTAPLVWPVLEFVRNLGQIAFPWDLLGYSMTPWLPFVQPASLGGVYLVSAWLVLVNVLVYRLVFPAPGVRASRPAVRLWPALGLVTAFLVPLGFAALRIRPNRAWFDVAVLQPNVSPLDKGDRASREQIYDDLLRLTRTAAARRPDLIVYPETATLLDVADRTDIGRLVRGLVDSIDIEVVTGTPLYDYRHCTWHNGAVLLRPGEDSVRQRYYKMRLVPFSEKIPYSDQVPLVRKVIGTADMGNWDRGWLHTVFHWNRGTFSCLICFEAIFPDLTREFVRRGAELLVVVTNDGWFGRLPGAHQHAELAVMRAVENGVPMVRSANNGISFIIDPYGRVLRKTGLFTQGVLFGEVPAASTPTLYRRFGDWFIAVCLAALLVIAAGRLTGAFGRRRPG